MGQAPFEAECMQFGRVLSVSQHDDLIRVLTEDEIKRALFDIGDLKAPRLDGYCSKFYKHARDTITHDFTVAILEFFLNGQFLISWNHTLIALVSKSTHASKVQDY